VDPERLCEFKPSSLVQYRRASQAFLDFMDSEGFTPDGAEAWDDLLVEWSYQKKVSTAQFSCAIAAVGMVYPRLKSELTWARQRLSTLEKLHPAQHAAPAGRELCALLGSQLAASRRARMGLALMVQNALGLRPSEALRLTPEDMALSPEGDKAHVVVVRLGARVGTKIGREQFALLDTRRWKDLWRVLTIAIQLTPAFHRLFPYSLASYYHWLKRSQAAYGLALHITPHSPRAGYVTDELVLGTSAVDIRVAGRWSSETSFRRYVDAVGALAAAQAARTAGLGPVIGWVLSHLDDYFNEVSLDVYGGQPEAGPRPSRRLAPEEAPQECWAGPPGDQAAGVGGGVASRGRGRGSASGGPRARAGR